MAENETERIQLFSEGLFAMALTRLVLTIQSPAAAEIESNRELPGALGRLWPSFLAFVLSFVVMLMIWANDHDSIRMLRGVDRSLLFAKGGLLRMVTFLPFPTAILAGHLHAGASNATATFYCGTISATNIAHHLLFEVATRNHRLLRRDVSHAEIRRIQ
jgi:uncharacterized membrane protein